MRHIDLYGHVHNSAYLDYAEDAIVAFLRLAGLRAHFLPDRAPATYVVKRAEVVFSRSLIVEDEVQPIVRLAHLGRTSLSFETRLLRAEDQLLAATCHVTWVCVGQGGQSSTQIPDETRVALQPFLSENEIG